jgi:hypothetical protein
MRYYLRHLLELYAEYMGLALLGMLLSAIVLSSYSGVRSGNIVLTVLGALVLLLVLWVSTKVIMHLYRSCSEKRVIFMRNRAELSFAELVRSQQEAHHQRNPEKMAEARKYLRFLNAAPMTDTRHITPDLLVEDLVVLMEQLQEEHLGKRLIEDAAERFLSTVEKTDNSFIYSVRQQILWSIISEAIISNTVINNKQRGEERRRLFN